MLRIFNGVLVVTVICCAFVLYSLEHASRQNERQIAKMKRQIAEEHENIKLLNAEWSFLNKPERLERLAREHLKLRPVEPQQRINQAELAALLPDRPKAPVLGDGADPIGDMLKGLE
jgi:cell division protein FtsL